MRVLILSCNTGQGHNSVASAMAEALERCGIPCDCEDAIGFVSDNLSQFMSWGHSYMYRHAPKLFDLGYGFAEKHTGLMNEDGKVYKLFARGAQRLRELCGEKGYDTVLCPHVFSAMLTAETRRRYDLKLKSYFIATDYTCSPGVGGIQVDGWFIPHEALTPEFVEAGVPRDRVFPVGIPVRESFYRQPDRDAAKVKLGIDPTHRHLLMSCGSMGCGPMEELADHLCRSLPAKAVLTVVCGTNERLYRKLSERCGDCENLRILGYCQNMELQMAGADLYLTKPGGISVTEAAVLGLPMVLVNAVSGCEEYNLRFFLEQGVAVTGDTADVLAKLCLELLANDRALEKMRAAYGKPPMGARQLCDCILAQC